MPSSAAAPIVPQAPPAAERTIRKKSRHDWRAGLWALFFLGPNLALFLLFTAYPVIYGLYLSFYNYSIIKPAKYVGLDNYRFFFNDSLTPTLLKNTLYFALGSTLPAIIIPLIIAVLLQRAGRAKNLFRSFYFVPLVTSPVAAAAVWKWLYGKDFGLINYGIRSIGGQPIDFLFNLEWAMPAVIFMNIWLLMPFNIILYTAGLQEIPRDLYEASELDGASAFQQFVNITIPLITPTTFFVLLITLIGVLVGGFDSINVLTRGGPLDSTNIIIYDVYLNAFEYFRMGYASAQAYMLFVIVFIVTVFNWILQKKWVHY